MIHLCNYLSSLQGFFVYICTCFCFPHLLTMCPPSSFESALNYVCILHGTIVFDIFFINPNTKPLFIFLPFPHGHIVLTGGSRLGAPHHRRHHPKTPGGGPAPPSSCRARSAPRHESPGHAHLHAQPGCPPVEAGEAG